MTLFQRRTPVRRYVASGVPAVRQILRFVQFVKASGAADIVGDGEFAAYNDWRGTDRRKWLWRISEDVRGQQIVTNSRGGPLQEHLVGVPGIAGYVQALWTPRAGRLAYAPTGRADSGLQKQGPRAQRAEAAARIVVNAQAPGAVHVRG